VSGGSTLEDVFGIRIHGRGGQGVVTAAELMSVAAFDAGKHAQAFPSFGSERTGAPVVAYCRISEAPIRNREPIVVPDGLIVQDATLLHQVDLLSGLPRHAYVLVNTRKSFAELGLAEFAADHQPARLLTVPATDIAMRHLGRPVPNAVLLGGFAALTGVVSLGGVQQALLERFPGQVGAANAQGAAEAYERVLLESAEVEGEDRRHVAAD
jgi:pyruvate ferredoxin oxidoreductase gamma subunit